MSGTAACCRVKVWRESARTVNRSRRGSAPGTTLRWALLHVFCAYCGYGPARSVWAAPEPATARMHECLSDPDIRAFRQAVSTGSTQAMTTLLKRLFDYPQNDMSLHHHPRNGTVTPSSGRHADEAIVRVGRTFLSADVRESCQPDVAARETRPPRIWAGEGFRCTSSREDGRFFAPLRMTCLAIGIGEEFRTHVCKYCHPEEVRPARDSLAGRLTKDLLRHRLMLERLLSFAVTWQAARLRRTATPRKRKCRRDSDIRAFRLKLPGNAPYSPR